MNYLKEINAFHDRIVTNPLSVGAKVLWFTLMQVNNKARWVKEFSIAGNLICCLTGLSKSSFLRARAELRDKGFITYRSRGTKAPMYQMVSLVHGVFTEEMAKELGQDMSKVDHQEIQNREEVEGVTKGLKKDASSFGRRENGRQAFSEDVVPVLGRAVNQVEKRAIVSQDENEEVAQVLNRNLNQEVDQVVNQNVAPLYKQKDENKTTTSSYAYETLKFFEENFWQVLSIILCK